MALRLGAMVTKADNNGAGSSWTNRALAATLRWGIGERDEFSVGAYYLDNDNGMNYGMPWIRTDRSQPRPVAETTSCCRSRPQGLLRHGQRPQRRQADASRPRTPTASRRSMELVTKLRRGEYERDQRAGTVRFAAAARSRAAWP
jgi:catecholate siderophore receptor